MGLNENVPHRICILGLQLAILIGEAKEARSFWGKDVTEGWALRFQSYGSFQVCSLCLVFAIQDVSPQLLAPDTMPSLIFYHSNREEYHLAMGQAGDNGTGI